MGGSVCGVVYRWSCPLPDEHSFFFLKTKFQVRVNSNRFRFHQPILRFCLWFHDRINQRPYFMNCKDCLSSVLKDHEGCSKKVWLRGMNGEGWGHNLIVFLDHEVKSFANQSQILKRDFVGYMISRWRRKRAELRPDSSFEPFLLFLLKLHHHTNSVTLETNLHRVAAVTADCGRKECPATSRSPATVSLPRGFQRKVMSSLEWAGEGGADRGCFWQIASLSRLDGHFQPPFSSLAARFPPCCVQRGSKSVCVRMC